MSFGAPSQHQHHSSSFRLSAELTILLQNLPLPSVNIPQSNVHESLRFENRFDPPKFGNLLLTRSGQAEEEGDGAAVEVS